MDPNVARLIERTRARRGVLHSTATDGSPLPSERERSPLKERNSGSPTRLRSPAKASLTSSSRASPGKGSVNIPVSRSPAKTVPEYKGGEESPSNTIRRLLSRGSLEKSVQELIHQESPGKTAVSRTVSTKVSSPSKGGTTITKTVITEKEERYEKKEVISYSGNKEFLKELDLGRDGQEFSSATYRKSGPGEAVETRSRSPHKRAESPMKSPSKREQEKQFEKDQLSPMPDDDFHSGRKARLANLANKFKNYDEDREAVFKEEVKLPQGAVKPPPRAPSPSKHAPVRTDHLRRRSPSPTKSHPLHFISPTKSPTKPPSVSPTRLPGQDFRSVLASKASAATPSGPPARPHSPSKPKAPSAPPARPHSPTKPRAPSTPSNLRRPSDASFVTSLKAQGFQETGSKSKLVYDFQKEAGEEEEQQSYADNMFLLQDSASRDTVKDSASRDSARDQLSPMRASLAGPCRDRSPSPVRNNVFLQRDQERGRTSVRKTGARAASPAKPLQREGSPSKPRAPSPSKPLARVGSPSKPLPRNVSPSKPHPMQSISGPALAAPAPGPAKPSRTFASRDMGERQEHPVDTLQAKSLTQKRSMFESCSSSPQADSPDPSSIPLSQRKALFEKVKSVPTPIARFGESVTPAMLARSRPVAPTVETPSEAWKRKRAASPGKVVSPRRAASPRREEVKPSWVREQSPPCSGVEDRQRRLVAAQTPDWRDNEIAKKAAQEKQVEMDLLLNRYKHLKKDEPSSATKTPQAHTPKVKVTPHSPKTATPGPYYPGVNSMKRVRVSPPKEGHLYPSIDTDSDRPHSAMSETDTANDSFESVVTAVSESPSLGQNIVVAARMVEQELGTIPEDRMVEQELGILPRDHSDSMDTDDGCGLTDSVLEAALEEEEGGHTPPKVAKMSTSSSGSEGVGRSSSSSSWQFHTPTPATREDKFKTPMIVPNSPGPASPGVEVEGSETPLMHTVSFYRAQKPAVTPVHRVVAPARLEEVGGGLEVASPRASISQRIHRLEEEANTQMPVIQQASSALTLCRSTKEFFGSAEQVEGERLLLVASHKRAAALTEIQQLKTEGGLGADPNKEGRGSVRGTVSLSGITLGLKREFLAQLESGEVGDFVHFFLCLVKCGGQVVPTTMVTTAEGLEGGSLHFPNLIKFRDLGNDFSIQLEVYGLQTKREVLGHEAKYHIAGAGSKATTGFLAHLTPKMKFSKTESRLTRPAVSSPGGPHSVRTSSFAMVGQARVTIHSLAETAWRLASVPPISPLQGTLHLALNGHSESQVTNQGFLTMFDDVSGFGAWHRRWLVLEGSSLSFWKYPENQTKQEPIGRIDLARCVSEAVTIAPREVCSRMHTFMLETDRAASRSDVASLVVVKSSNSRTVLRHLLSADSRVERVAWCDSLNRALDNLRAWDTSRARASSSSSLESDTVSTVSGQSTDIW